MFLYHVNVGWPLLDEGARLAADIGGMRWASDSVAAAESRPPDLARRAAPSWSSRSRELALTPAAPGGPGGGRQRPTRPAGRGGLRGGGVPGRSSSG